MDSYVVKVQFEDKLRRLTLLDEGAFSYGGLLNRIRDIFQLPSTAELVLTYTDSDGDVVTMGEDQDLKDALVLQSLNPLRLNATTVGSGSAEPDVKMSDAPSEIKSDQNKSAGPSADAGATAAKKSEQKKVHRHITCDDCGVSPIVGRRFKSLKKADFDLCQRCFEKSGVDPNEYIVVEQRFGRPHSRHAFRAYRGGDIMTPFDPIFDLTFGYHGSRGERGAATSAFTHRRGSSRFPERDAARGETFVSHRREVIECDGCAMKPILGTRFGSNTKFDYDLCLGCFEKLDDDAKAEYTRIEFAHDGIECDGCATSPIVGSRFTSNTKFDYDLCLECFEKLDNDGAKAEYTRIDHPFAEEDSHRLMLKRLKRLASPYGCPSRRRRIWIMSTVDSESDNDQRAEATATPTAAADAVATKQAEVTAVNKEVTMEEAGGSQSPGGGSKEQQPEPMSQADANDVRNADTEAPVPEDDLSTTEGLLGKLAAMGFTDKELNEDLLKKNNLNLQTTVDELCAAKEWTPILEELQEMGFYDTDMNRHLLIANNGNVKMVVKLLVQNAKEEARAAAILKGKMQE